MQYPNQPSYPNNQRFESNQPPANYPNQYEPLPTYNTQQNHRQQPNQYHDPSSPNGYY